MENKANKVEEQEKNLPGAEKNTAEENEKNPPVPLEEKKSNIKSAADFDRMAKSVGNQLAKQPQVEIKIPIDKRNELDKVVAVRINGYIYEIKRGEKVKVPQTVAQILEDADYI